MFKKGYLVPYNSKILTKEHKKDRHYMQYKFHKLVSSLFKNHLNNTAFCKLTAFNPKKYQVLLASAFNPSF